MLGGIDKVDETWVNGKPIGNSFGYGTERPYELPAGTLHAGDNTIVVNVSSSCCSAGMYGPPEHMMLRFRRRRRGAFGRSVALSSSFRKAWDFRRAHPGNPWAA